MSESNEIKRVESWVEHDSRKEATESMNQVSDRVRLVIEAAEQAAGAIREDAQRQAQDYLNEAQRRADQLTAERVQLIANLTDELIEHAGAVRSHSEEMVASLERTIESVTEGRAIEVEGSEPPSLASGSTEPTAIDDPPDADDDSSEVFSDADVEAPAAGSDDAEVLITAYGGDEGDGDDPDPDYGAAEADPEADDSDTNADAEVEGAAVLHATRLAIAGSERDEIEAELDREFELAEDAMDEILDRVLGSE